MPPCAAIAITVDASLKSASAPKPNSALTPVLCSSASSSGSRSPFCSDAMFLRSGSSGAAPRRVVVASSKPGAE
jgi:hypothetical protein